MLKVDENKCIGCGACVSIVPEVFDFNDEGYAMVKETITSEDLENNKEDITEAAEGCPTSAIENN